ncbi:hypothetical protein [Candidatus Lokiarchaeum ossiferum]|uniref:hypothetical protein n=1 Tax=Candidatus Lokiarchaeum ossiferum TaxID=2951803 RepID=UPI00352CA355
MSPRSQKLKKDKAIKLLNEGIPYRRIQELLKDEFGSGMSNSSLKNLHHQNTENVVLRKEIKKLKAEIEVWKGLYFEIKEATEIRIKQQKKQEKKKTEKKGLENES